MIDPTLNSFLKQECANYSSEKCRGVNIEGIGFNIDGNCWILKDRKPCKHFESSVLGYAKYLGCYDKILREYQDINLSIKKLKMRKCRCGAELLKGKQLCDKCRLKNRQKTERINKRKQRENSYV